MRPGRTHVRPEPICEQYKPNPLVTPEGFPFWKVDLATRIDPTSVGSRVGATRGPWFAGTRQPEERVVRRRGELPQEGGEPGPVKHCCPQQFPLERGAPAVKRTQRRIWRHADRRDRRRRRSFGLVSICRATAFQVQFHTQNNVSPNAGTLASIERPLPVRRVVLKRAACPLINGRHILSTLPTQRLAAAAGREATPAYRLLPVSPRSGHIVLSIKSRQRCQVR